MAVKKSIKLDTSYLTQIYEVQKRKTLIDSELASIGKTEIIIKRRKTAVEGFMEKTDEIEKQLAISLQKEHGEGTIDTAKGLFVPS